MRHALDNSTHCSQCGRLYYETESDSDTPGVFCSGTCERAADAEEARVELTEADFIQAYKEAYEIIHPVAAKLASGPTAIWEKLRHAENYIDKQIREILAPPADDEPVQYDGQCIAKLEATVDHVVSETPFPVIMQRVHGFLA
jgi:hypothetical protein